jgi:Ca2+-binding EF-hand superfamily protein
MQSIRFALVAGVIWAGFGSADTGGVNATDVNAPARDRGKLLRDADANQDGVVSLEEIQRLVPNFPVERFQRLDRNGDGLIANDEIGAMRRAESSPGGDAFQRADADGNGEITLQELKAVFPRMTRERFAQLDRDGDGVLQAGEARAPIPRGAAPGTREVFQKADANADGKVTFDELKAQSPGLTRERFNLMDRDGDGELSKGDWGATATRNENRGESRSSRLDAAKKLMETDVDKDQTVTFEEVIQAKPGFPRDAFDRYDANGDGVLTRDDYAGR